MPVPPIDRLPPPIRLDFRYCSDQGKRVKSNFRFREKLKNLAAHLVIRG